MLRQKLIKRAHVFYQHWFKKTHIGRFLGSLIIKGGFLSYAEIFSLQETGHPMNGIDDIDEPLLTTNTDIPGFHIDPPLNINLSGELTVRPHINLLLPSLRVQDMSGGPNTALLIAARLAEAGELVRLISTGVPMREMKNEAFYLHMDGLLQRPVDRARITLVDGTDRSKPVMIGAYDIFLATAWWTAQIAKYAIQKTKYDQFIYLIQDFEPILHEGSTLQARALETYGFSHIPVINTRLLLDHLIKEGCGCYSQPAFAKDALFFEPAIDRSRYFPDIQKVQISENHKRHVLLFYARPTYARRNLFEIGVAALRKAVAAGLLDKDGWEIWGMGEKFEPISLGKDIFLNPLPWMSFDDYAKRIRTSDLLLSLMLSPHPSYPPLEMAASGRLVVTNSFSVKTIERLRSLSPNILVAEPNPDGIATALESAMGRINLGLPSHDPTGTIELPSNWDESLANIVPQLKERIDALRNSPSQIARTINISYPSKPRSDYELFRRHRLMSRRQDGQYSQEPGLLSFITSAYDTNPKFLEELASSILLQDGGTKFEWLILDNGSSNESTRETLRTIARHPCVRLERVDKNLGIIRGMRYCLEHATGRYILPIDSDDIIEPDCVHVLTRFIQEADYPTLLYTDEDKLADGQFVSPYFKPDWDPVLFTHSCYIAHLCAMDREKALALNLYSDSNAEGSHDWDSFIRFMNAGYMPLHVPEVLYSWRAHNMSTSGNIASKSYITASHRATLQRFLDHAGASNVELVPSPLFGHNVDWWFRRKRDNPVRYISAFIGSESIPTCGSVPQHVIVPLNHTDGIARLAEILGQSLDDLLHISWSGITPNSDEWFWEAMGLFELFPDAVMVGGILHDGNKVLSGPRIFGFGDGFDSPYAGRQIADPGYFAAMWKSHSVSALSSGHCVVRLDFLKEVIGELIQEHVTLDMLGLWLGALAKEMGKRVVFSPFFSALAKSVPEDTISPEYRARFLSRFWHLMPDDQLLSTKLGLDQTSAYRLVAESEREQHLQRLQRSTQAYSDWFEVETRHRASRYPLPEEVVTLSIITAVYEGSDIALLDKLADSITGQTLHPVQWVIVVNGPIHENNLQYIRNKAKTSWGATVIVDPQSLGIIGALRFGLEYAEGQYILPVDADDVLTLDALQILAHEIVRRDWPDLVFSDEDMLIDERLVAPYLRSKFDPILNLDSSYIWHLFAMKRETAVKLGVYTDSRANWCQDWDSITRIANAGGRIEHVPEILYHWRQHANSTTNKPEGDPRSLDSVRYLLEEQITLRKLDPEKFSVELWPVSRGVKELYIARQDIDLPKFVWIGDLDSDTISDNSSDDITLIMAKNGITIDEDRVFTEAARLFGLHPRLAAIGGRVVGSDGLVVDGCLVANQSGEMESPWVGHHVNDVGPYALASKPLSVDSTGTALAFFRLKVIRELGIPLPEDPQFWSSWILSTCKQLRPMNWMIAYSPLIKARATKGSPITHLVHRFPQASDSSSSHPLARYGKQCRHGYHWRRQEA